MHPILQEINDLYLQIPNFPSPSPEYIGFLKQQDEVLKEQPEERQCEWRCQFAEQRKIDSSIYNSAIEKFNAVSHALSPIEVIEAYNQGCRSLQNNLSGHMSHNFDRAYIPLMLNAIENDGTRAAYLFLPVLTRHLGEEIAALTIKSLDSQFIEVRLAALSVIDELGLIEAIPDIRTMMAENQDPEIAEVAQQVIQRLENIDGNRT